MLRNLELKCSSLFTPRVCSSFSRGLLFRCPVLRLSHNNAAEKRSWGHDNHSVSQGSFRGKTTERAACLLVSAWGQRHSPSEAPAAQGRPAHGGGGGFTDLASVVLAAGWRGRGRLGGWRCLTPAGAGDCCFSSNPHSPPCPSSISHVLLAFQICSLHLHPALHSWQRTSFPC